MQLSKDVYEMELKKKKKRTLKVFSIRKTFYLGVPYILFSNRFMCF